VTYLVLEDNAAQAADLLKSLANPTRLLILCALLKGEHTAGALEKIAGLSQSALSQHLARLRAECIVQRRREGARLYYRLDHEAARRVLEALHEIYCADPPTVMPITRRT